MEEERITLSVLTEIRKKIKKRKRFRVFGFHTYTYKTLSGSSYCRPYFPIEYIEVAYDGQ